MDAEPAEPNASRWAQLGGAPRGAAYARRFDALAQTGADVHGEATFCARLAEPGARILDAGCGTGRVAVRLAELGYDCTGVDSDELMLAAAPVRPGVRWVLGDLADLSAAPAVDGPFGLIVAAGNVIPLLAPGSESAVLRALSDRLLPGGRLVAGFGLDRAHLPFGPAPFGLAEYDAWCTDADLELEQRLATWAGASYAGGGYAVSVHARRS